MDNSKLTFNNKTQNKDTCDKNINLSIGVVGCIVELENIKFELLEGQEDVDALRTIYLNGIIVKLMRLQGVNKFYPDFICKNCVSEAVELVEGILGAIVELKVIRRGMYSNNCIKGDEIARAIGSVIGDLEGMF